MARDRRTIRAGAREETRRERGVAGRAVDATPASVKARRHIDDFFTEYDDHGDVTRARGDKKSARYKALQKLANKPDAECSDRELRLKELWVVADPFRSVPRKLRDILMDIIEYPESSRDEALAAWYRKITGEPETRNGRSNIV